MWGWSPLNNFQFFASSGKYSLTIYPVSRVLLINNFSFKSKEINNESFISFIAFNIKTDEPPRETPISRQFFGLNFLINILLL